MKLNSKRVWARVCVCARTRIFGKLNLINLYCERGTPKIVPLSPDQKRGVSDACISAEECNSGRKIYRYIFVFFIHAWRRTGCLSNFLFIDVLYCDQVSAIIIVWCNSFWLHKLLIFATAEEHFIFIFDKRFE